MQFYTFDEAAWSPAAESRPVLLHFFEGFMDAGKVSETISAYLMENLETQVLAEFDTDLFHDYRARRPRMTFDTDEWRSVEEVKLSLHVTRDLTERPFLILTGPEPDMRWHGLRSAMIELFGRLDVSLTATARGVPMAVPHTRELPMTTHSTTAEYKRKNPPWVDRMELPGSFASYLELGLGQAGRAAMGTVTYVPHYLAQSAFLSAAEKSLDHLAQVTDLVLPMAKLHQDAQENLEVINSEVNGNAEIEQVIAALEAQYDDFTSSETADLPTAEELGAEFERFLAEEDERKRGPEIGPSGIPG